MNFILKNFIDLIYPPRCPICDMFVKDNDVPCDSCRASLHVIEADAAFLHLPHLWTDRCLACFAYEGKLRDALHGFKYQKRLDQVRYFGGALARRAGSFDGFDLVAPVPMHGRRLRERGFNQAALLARQVGKILGSDVDLGLLVRARDDGPQVGLERDLRLKNIKGAFDVSARRRDRLAGRAVLLIDDVVTTGATVNECARVLKGAGASKVYALAVARTL